MGLFVQEQAVKDRPTRLNLAHTYSQVVGGLHDHEDILCVGLRDSVFENSPICKVLCRAWEEMGGKPCENVEFCVYGSPKWNEKTKQD